MTEAEWWFAGKPLMDGYLVWANRAVVFVDIVESVRLIEQDEARVISRWRAIVERIRTEVLQRFDGRLVKSTGDGVLLDFDDVRNAVSSAFAIQQISRELNANHPAEHHILLRAGVEVSDVVVQDNDLFGRGVNLAARLMTLAGPGETVITQRVRDRLTQSLDADVEDLGDCYLRHIALPVRAYRVGPPSPRLSTRPTLVMDEIAPSIAVMPFEARPRPAEEGEVLGEVLAEEIIRCLSRTPELNVISRLSTSAFSGRAATLGEIGQHLQTEYVLSGSYSSDGTKILLNAELAETGSGRILWTRRMSGQVADLFSEEQEIVGQLAAEVQTALESRELARSRLQPLPSLRSYTLLMGAIALMHRLSSRDFDEAHNLLEALIERGRRQPIPQAWLANWHVLRVQQGWSSDPQKDAYLATESTKRALDVDPDCSLALAVDGLVHTNLLRKLDVASDRYDHAIRANPSNALAWLLRGTLHAFKSEGAEAVENTERALKLTPLDPHRYFYDSLAATACVSARQYERAIELARRSLRVNRLHTSTLRVLIASQWHLGREEEARQTAKDLLKLQPDLTVSGWLRNSPAAPYAVGQETAQALRGAGIPE
jgi:class 3 adenylate cyclase/TolB-like protein/Tfp pilus assembly protein PilF